MPSAQPIEIILLRLKIVNNTEPTNERKRYSWECAMRELDKFGGQQRDMPYSGFLLLTHGYLFEATEEGWIIRPRRYLKEFPESLPPEKRRAFYEKRHWEKFR